MAKKIYLTERQLNNNFNNEGNVMSELEKELKGYSNNEKYASFDPFDLDDEEVDEDERYNTLFISNKLNDAVDSLYSLSDYLENSEYAKEKGGEKFKGYLERIKKICDQLENFLYE